MRIHYYNPYFTHWPVLSTGYYYYAPYTYIAPLGTAYPSQTMYGQVSYLPSDYSDILSVAIANNLGTIPTFPRYFPRMRRRFRY
ncbi:MAG: hypothetical protein E6713_11635 [Sporomusaceae bacterium]|nr:hypothetical protein [Sporomusaceae bacterium]